MMTQDKTYKPLWRSSLALLLLLLCFSLNTQAQDYVDDVRRATNSFDIGDFDDVIITLDSCIKDKSADVRTRKEALELRSRTYLFTDREEDAKKDLRTILTLDPNYDPSSQASPLYTQLVTEVRVDMMKGTTNSVSKTNEKLELVPATVAVVTQEDFHNRGYLDIEQMFHDLPGFNISKSNGVAYVNIYQRGYRSALNTDRTMLLIDGMEENSIHSNTANISRQYPISNLKRVDVIYGPASTMYGANAYTGVINMVTVDAADLTDYKDGFGVRGTVGYGEFNTRYIDMTTGLKRGNFSMTLTGRLYKANEADRGEYANWSDDFSEGQWFNGENYVSNLTLTSGDDGYDTLVALGSGYSPYYRIESDGTIVPTQEGLDRAREIDSTYFLGGEGNRNPYGEYADPVDDWYVAGKLQFNKLKAGFHIWEISEGASGSYSKFEFSPSDGESTWETKQAVFYMNWERQLTSKLLVSAMSTYKMHLFPPTTILTQNRAYYNGRKGMYDLVLGSTDSNGDGIVDSIPYWRPLYFYQKSNQQRTEVRGSYTVSENFSIVAGVEQRLGTFNGNYLITVDTTDRPDLNGELTDEQAGDGGDTYFPLDLGLYWQASYEPDSIPLKLTVGVRGDYNRVTANSGYGLKWNPRLSAVYHTPNERMILKLVYSQAFKDAPPLLRYTNTPSRSGNIQLRPETVKNLELSARYAITPKMVIDGSFYRAAYDLVIRDTSSTSVQAYSNGATQEIFGSQIQFNYVTRRAVFYSNFTYTRGTAFIQQLGTTVDVGDIAPWNLNAGVNVQLLRAKREEYDKLNLNFRLNYVAEKPTGEGTTVNANAYNRIADYTVVNSAITYRLTRDFSFQFIANNILGKEYFHPGVRNANGESFVSELPQLGRTFYVRLTYNFASHFNKPIKQ